MDGLGQAMAGALVTMLLIGMAAGAGIVLLGYGLWHFVLVHISLGWI